MATNYTIYTTFVGLYGRTNPEYWLEQAENYLDKKPDSTLIFLEKIKNPDQLADYPKAKYDLFQTIAGLRKGQAIRTDSLLTKAIDIFIANNDSAKTSNACFWSGFINMQTANYMRADSFFTLGIPFATNPVVRTRLYEYSGFAFCTKATQNRHCSSIDCHYKTVPLSLPLTRQKY